MPPSPEGPTRPAVLPPGGASHLEVAALHAMIPTLIADVRASREARHLPRYRRAHQHQPSPPAVTVGAARLGRKRFLASQEVFHIIQFRLHHGLGRQIPSKANGVLPVRATRAIHVNSVD